MGSAVLWWQRAADAGKLAAMWRLGNLAEEAGDVEGARSWYEQATHGGSRRARDRLRKLDAAGSSWEVET